MRKKNRFRGPICGMKISAYSYLHIHTFIFIHRISNKEKTNRLSNFVLKDFLEILVCFQGVEKIKDTWQPCMISMSVCKPSIYYLK